MNNINIELLDDLRYFWASTVDNNSTMCDHDAANEVVSKYTDDPLHYSDGSPVGTEYLSDDPKGVVRYQAFKPPHRRLNSNTTEETTS